MNHKKLVLLIIPFLLVSLVSALDLSDYPDMFIEDDKFNGILVVADNAPAVAKGKSHTSDCPNSWLGEGCSQR